MENCMLDWMGLEGDAIRIAFSRVFGTGYRPFGSQALQLGGLSDGNDGAQWNVAYDPRDGRQWVGVNLEGVEYDDWPVARLIERELRDPSLPELVDGNPALHDVIMVWHRDYWQASSRPGIEEKVIAEIPLGQLTPGRWSETLTEAQACLDPRRKHRGRATQTVTVASGRVEGEVSPHLMFRYMAPGTTEWENLFREWKACLQPLYDWASRRARQAVRF